MSYYAPTGQDTEYLSVLDLSLTIGSWQSQEASLVFTSVTGEQQLSLSNRPPRNVVVASEKALSILIW